MHAVARRALLPALKRYTSPLSLLVGRREDGRWLILEERSESQP